MNKVLSILQYEYKMQMQRVATWGVLLAATFITMLDSFPSIGNLALGVFITAQLLYLSDDEPDGIILVYGL